MKNLIYTTFLLLICQTTIAQIHEEINDTMTVGDWETDAGRILMTEINDEVRKNATKLVLIPGGKYKENQLDTFYLDEHLVTVGQYEACVAAGVCPEPADQGGWADTYNRKHRLDRELYPVNQVHFFNAKTYCDWVEKRMPTAAEWEWAARGRDEARIYPWGNEEPTAESACWFRYVEETDGGRGTCKVKQYAPSRDGVYDMAGYQWEWTSTYLDKDKKLVVMKGGAWYNDNPLKLQAEYQRGGASLYERSEASEGFRCASDVKAIVIGE